MERRANGIWLIADGKSERGSAGLAGLARSSNHTHETDRRNQMNQLPATRCGRAYGIRLLLRFALWYCVRIRAKETFAVEVDHVVGIFGNPNLRFPGDVG